MKKGQKAKRLPKNDDIDSLLKTFKSTDPKGLSEKIIKNFILHTLYFFNLKLDIEGMPSILEAIEKKFDRSFRSQCDSILKINKNQKTRSGQNKALHKKYDLPLLLGEDGEFSYARSHHYKDAALDSLRLFVLLKVGEDVNKRYKTSASKDRKVALLELACGMNCVVLVEDLIRLGANYKSQESSRNPLEICVRRNHIQTTRYLFEKAYVSIESELLLSEIYNFAFGYMNIPILELLIRNNLLLKSELESTQQDRSENPVLMLKFVKGICKEGVTKEALAVFELYLQKGYRVSGVDEQGETTLSIALTFKCIEVFRLIMLHAPKSASEIVNKMSLTSCTALTKAVSMADETVVKKLLDLGADPKLPIDKPHLQPLSAARYLKNDAMMMLLHAHGVQETSLDPVLACARSDTLEVALQRSLIYAITTFNLQLTTDILRSGDCPDLLLSDIRSPLFYAMISYLEAENEERKESSYKIFEGLIQYGANVQQSLFRDRNLTPLQFCMKHDLPIFIPLLLSCININSQSSEHIEALGIACTENSVDSLKVYFSSGGDIPNDISIVMKLLAESNRLNFYDISKELIIKLGNKLLTPDYQTRFFRLFSFKYLSLYEEERVAYKDKFMEVLSYLDWYVGLPKKIEDGEGAVGARKLLEEMKEFQAHHDAFRAYIVDKLLKYSENHQIKMSFEFNTNLMKVFGEFSKFKLINDFIRLGIIVCKVEDDFLGGMFFPYPSRQFIDDFNALFSKENYLQYSSGTEFSSLISVAGELTVGQQLRQITLAARTKKTLSSDAHCWNGLINNHQADVHSIKYSDDYVVLLDTILGPQGVTFPLLKKLKMINRLGSNNAELIARLDGEPLFQTVILENGDSHTIPVTHRLTLALSPQNNYCSVALGAVLSDDKQHIFYVGLHVFKNALTEEEHVKELTEKCQKTISIADKSFGVLCIGNN